jgi:hypothetical protein
MDKIYGASIRQDGLQKVGRNRWDLFYGFGKDEDNEMGYNWRTSFDHQPTIEEVKETIITQISANTQKAIIEGYKWEGHLVWLSSENQANYTRDYIMAKNGDLGTMPTVKLGSDDAPVYYTFEDIEELTEFVMGMQQHIQNCLNASWTERKEIDWSVFS